MRIVHHALSDVGLRRRSNEDSLLADPERQLFLVADGMGGHAAGEVASRLAAESIGEFIRQTGSGAFEWPFGFDPSLSWEGNRLRSAILHANVEIIEASAQRREYRGMATTVVAVLVNGQAANVAHAGDSRAYLLRDSVLAGLTTDHSWVSEKIQSGQLTPEEARRHPMRTMVTRALGGRRELEVELKTLALQAGDILLLCSDGLTSMVPEAQIAGLIGAARGRLEPAARNLVAEANARGGEDNVTVLLIQFQDGPP